MTAPELSRAEMERAYLAADAAYDGLFYTAVRTTGIFCRPGCPARKPKPQNVTFYPTAAAAQAAGYRPCLRCHPLLTAQAPPPWVAELKQLLAQAPEARLTDQHLQDMGLHPATVRRTWQRYMGISFQAYQRGVRLGQAFSRMQQGQGLEDAIHASGYASHSGFRQAFQQLFGHAPGQTRSGADALHLQWLETPIGPLVAAATPTAVVMLEFPFRRLFERQVAGLRQHFPLPVLYAPHPLLNQLETELQEYFRGERTAFTVPLHAPGTAFEQEVWAALQAIPAGHTRSYVQLATRLGQPGASRAIGRANGANRLAIVIPCHRVVAADGSLGGYGGGLPAKQWLLRLEQPHRPTLDAQHSLWPEVDAATVL